MLSLFFLRPVTGRSALYSICGFALIIATTGCGHKIRQLRSDLQVKDSRIMMLEQDLAVCREETGNARERSADLLQQLEDRNTRITKLQAELTLANEKANASQKAMRTSMESQSRELNDRLANAMQKENELKTQVELLRSELATAKVDLEEARGDKTTLEKERDRIESALKTKEAEATRLSEQTAALEKELADAKAQHQEQETALLAAQQSAADEWQKTLTEKEAELAAAQEKMSELNSDLRLVRDQLSDKEKSNEEIAGRIAALEQELATAKTAEKHAAPDAEPTPAAREAQSLAEQKLNSALRQDMARLNARGPELEISLFCDELFDSGTTLLTDRGLKALQSIDEVIQASNVEAIVVEGHTDNVPVQNMPYPDNWELAAARASEVVRWLAAQPGTDPKKIVAQSRAYYDPIGDNKTAAGRRLNRRVEIVLRFNPGA